MVHINPQAQSFLLTGHVDTACLFIHGFTASPSEVYPVARLLYEMTGCTVSGPLLPGHGTNPQNLNQTGWQDWLDRIEQEIEYLQRKHTRIYIAGLSMGGLLTLHAASKRRGLQGVIAINTPIYTSSPWLMAIAPFMRFVRPYYPKKMDRAAEELQTQGRFAYPVMPVKAFMSMDQLRKIVIQEIPSINIPILLFQSSQDESVDSRSAQFIKDKAVQAKIRLIELKKSGHIATMGEEQLIIAEEIAGFIKPQA
jgi:carboxylesterase